jgi:hypothetical protein
MDFIMKNDSSIDERVPKEARTLVYVADVEPRGNLHFHVRSAAYSGPFGSQIGQRVTADCAASAAAVVGSRAWQNKGVAKLPEPSVWCVQELSSVDELLETCKSLSTPFVVEADSYTTHDQFVVEFSAKVLKVECPPYGIPVRECSTAFEELLGAALAEKTVLGSYDLLVALRRFFEDRLTPFVVRPGCVVGVMREKAG